MTSLPELLKGCIRRDPHFMEQFYKKFAPEMWVVCLRYTRNRMMAEDVMQEGFIRVFDTIAQFQGSGSLEGWMKRVFVNTAINHFKKHYRFDKFDTALEDAIQLENQYDEDAISKLSFSQLLELLDTLPEEFKMVFNLFAIEGYRHQEIADMIGCSVANSRSRLSRARIHLQKQLGMLQYNDKKNNADIITVR